MIELLEARYIYLLVMVLLAIGLYGVLAKTDLVKKVIGLTIYSSAIFLFFIEGSLQDGATAPVLDERGTDPSLYVDPVPHLLILTAIVVGVAVVGVALSLLVRVYRAHGTFDESVIAEQLAEADRPGTTAPAPAADTARAPGLPGEDEPDTAPRDGGTA
jgi:multicomponent Na+:H+ antiporter subunit C